MPYNLCIIACGTMGTSILSGLLDNLSGTDPKAKQASVFDESRPASPARQALDDHVPGKFVVTVNRPETQRRLRRSFAEKGALGQQVDVRLSVENVKSVQESDVVILCSKPQLAGLILLEPGMREALAGKLLVSILAGTTISQMKEWVEPSTTVIRAMPNTPTRIREGMTVISSLDPFDPKMPQNKEILSGLFTPLGRCRFLDEKHFDAVTAVCGSGPAFVCLVIEAMADGGVMMGLPRAEALELAAQTMQGAARMVLQTGIHPAALKDSVTTPGGCTIAGLLTLEDGGVRSKIARCIQATTNHAAGLGKTSK